MSDGFVGFGFSYMERCDHPQDHSLQGHHGILVVGRSRFGGRLNMVPQHGALFSGEQPRASSPGQQCMLARMRAQLLSTPLSYDWLS